MEYTHCSPSFADLQTPGKGKSEDPKNSEILFFSWSNPFSFEQTRHQPHSPFKMRSYTEKNDEFFFFFFFLTILTEKAWSIKDLVYFFYNYFYLFKVNKLHVLQITNCNYDNLLCYGLQYYNIHYLFTPGVTYIH